MIMNYDYDYEWLWTMILWSSFNTFPIYGLLLFYLIKLTKTNRWTKTPNLTFFFLMIFLMIFLLLQQFNYTIHHFCSVFQCFCSQLSQFYALKLTKFGFFFSIEFAFLVCLFFVWNLLLFFKFKFNFYSIFYYNFYSEYHILILLYLWENAT
jgi:hypothetical protein